MDFALLLKRFLEHQDGSPELDHVFVDEFQDTNPIQYAIHLGWVQHDDARLTVVGDDDQALYRWRGSDIGCFSESGAGVRTRADRLPSRGARGEQPQHGHDRGLRARVPGRHGAGRATRCPRRSTRPEPRKLADPSGCSRATGAVVCARVAAEVDKLGAGQIIDVGQQAAPTVAILMASTSEVETRGPRPAGVMRAALEARGLRVYNPRNKSAARPGSPRA